MRLLRWTGPALFVLGIASLAYGLANGQGTLNLLVIFPVITATGPWTALGILLVVAGFVATFFFGFPRMEIPAEVPATLPPVGQPPGAARPARRWGGVVFLGPVPIVFGSDARVTRWMLAAGIVLFVALLLLTLLFVWGL